MTQQWTAAFGGNLPDGDDGTKAEATVLDALASVVREAGSAISSASFTGPSRGMVNLHEQAASDATHTAAETPAETGPAASGVGVGPEGIGTAPPPADSRRQILEDFRAGTIDEDTAVTRLTALEAAGGGPAPT